MIQCYNSLDVALGYYLSNEENANYILWDRQDRQTNKKREREREGGREGGRGNTNEIHIYKTRNTRIQRIMMTSHIYAKNTTGHTLSYSLIHYEQAEIISSIILHIYTDGYNKIH